MQPAETKGTASLYQLNSSATWPGSVISKSVLPYIIDVNCTVLIRIMNKLRSIINESNESLPVGSYLQLCWRLDYQGSTQIDDGPVGIIVVILL